MTDLVVTLYLPWWTGAYLNTVVFFCRTFGTEPDIDKIAHFIVRHARFS